MVFLVERELLAQEQYFGTQGRPGRKYPSQELDALDDCSNKDKKQRLKQLHDPEHVHLWNEKFKSAAGRDSLRQRGLGKSHLFICSRLFCEAQYAIGSALENLIVLGFRVPANYS
jgi:hypothetical protein